MPFSVLTIAPLYFVYPACYVVYLRENTSSELWNPVQPFTINTSSTVTVYFLQATITFHTIRLILCFQQTGEIDNLTVCWGKVLSLCCAGSKLLATPWIRFLPPTDSITLVS